MIENVFCFPPVGKSHHVVLTFDIPLVSEDDERLRGKFYFMDKGNYQLINDELNDVNWSAAFDGKSVDECWSLLHGKLVELQDSHIPSKVFTSGPKKKTVPPNILEKIKVKRKAFNWYKKYKTKENYNAYAKARNQLKWALRKNVKDKELDLANNAKTNPKLFFNYVSSKCKPKEPIATLRTSENQLTKSDKEKADVLNSFFVSVFTDENKANVPVFNDRTEVKLSTVIVSEEMIKKRLIGLKVNKSSGPDGLHPRLLKELADSLPVPLKMLFDIIMNSGKLPSAWKIAEVKPIFKKGDKQDPGNYRPVSLTSILCKLFEGFIRDSLNNHLLENNLLSVHQYGFTSGRSCITQLLSTVNDWLIDLDNSNSVDAIYLDLMKAFDTVPHLRLITKLKGYGIDDKLLDWIKDFLSNRFQYVKVGCSVSDVSDVTSGVPQGSVLGPTLFIYYINDMPDVLDCLIKIFADDTKIYSTVNNVSDALALQSNVDKLLDWSQQWQLTFNSKKCKVLHAGRKNCKHDYYMNGNKLEETTAEKDLGVIVDPDLSFNTHINETIKKANRLCGMLVGNIQCKDANIMVPLFKSLVRPVIEYGNPIWNTLLKKHTTPIEDIQRRFTKKIIGLNKLSYEERLAITRLPSLEYRRLRGDMIETFKIVHGFYDKVTVCSLFQFNTFSNTRGHPFKLHKPTISTSKFANFFTNRVINVWNNLPVNIVNAGTVNAFKNSLDRHWIAYMYKINLELISC